MATQRSEHRALAPIVVILTAFAAHLYIRAAWDYALFSLPAIPKALYYELFIALIFVGRILANVIAGKSGTIR
jgi:hypothetical protein